jgi:hypothetical protein
METVSATIINGPEKAQYLMCSRDGAVLVQENPIDAIRSIENSYNRNHSRGYEASMSAAVHAIMFRPTVVQIPRDLSMIIEMFDGLSLYRINNVSGTYYGRRLKPEVAKELLKDGREARIMS